MPTSLTPDRISNELLVEVLLTQEQITSSLAVMSLEVLKHPELVPKVRDLLGELLEVVHSQENELGIFGAQV
jgi:hypothetical protein